MLRPGGKLPCDYVKGVLVYLLCHFGQFWNVLVAFWVSFYAFGCLGTAFGVLVALLVSFGKSWWHFWCHWKCLGGTLGTIWGVFVVLLASLGPSWAVLGGKARQSQKYGPGNLRKPGFRGWFLAPKLHQKMIKKLTAKHTPTYAQHMQKTQQMCIASCCVAWWFVALRALGSACVGLRCIMCCICCVF